MNRILVFFIPILLFVAYIIFLLFLRWYWRTKVENTRREEAVREVPRILTVGDSKIWTCPSCGSMVDIFTDRRPIEVMCPKCGTSGMVEE